MSFSSSTTKIFVSCAGALEPFLKQEIEQLGISHCEIGFRGVLVPKDMQAVYRINYGSRIATRVLWPICQFPCRDKDDLYRGVSSVRWSDYIHPDRTFAIDANLERLSYAQQQRAGSLQNSHYASLIVKDAICDQQRDMFQRRSSIDTKAPDVQLNLFVQKGRGILYLDTSLQPLYKRGYRLETGEAPLQESLAAAILQIAGYDPKEHVLCDPFVGSGTFLMEAALIATKTPPGIFRKRWGFMAMPEFTQSEWQSVKREFDGKRISAAVGRIIGADEDAHMVEISRELFDKAGFGKGIEVYKRSIDKLHPPAHPNLVVGNPPYGKRLHKAATLEADIFDFIEREKVERAFFLFPDDALLTFPHKKVLSCLNGGLGVHLVEMQLI